MLFSDYFFVTGIFAFNLSPFSNLHAGVPFREPRAFTMSSSKFRFILFVLLCLAMSATFVNATPPATDTTITAIRYLGQAIIPHNQEFQGTIIGGLSGVDYDPEQNLYYLLSDDRSVINPVRFYTAKIEITPTGIDAVTFQQVFFLRQQNDSLFQSPAANPSGAVDPEAIRYDQRHQQLVWTSEGERRILGDRPVLVDPEIWIADKKGKYLGHYTKPSNLKMATDKTGPRQNSALEGLAFNNTFTKLFAAMEEPLYQDGPAADVNRPNALTRIFEFDTHSFRNTAQYIYPLEAVAYPATPAQSFKVNGVSEIMFVRQQQLLVVERSFSTGRLSCTVKIFLVDLSKAVNVKDRLALEPQDLQFAATKKLLFNLDDLGIYIDNVECVTWGPVLPNGHRTLIFVTDNNFLPTEQTQFFLFEVLP